MRSDTKLGCSKNNVFLVLFESLRHCNFKNVNIAWGHRQKSRLTPLVANPCYEIHLHLYSLIKFTRTLITALLSGNKHKLYSRAEATSIASLNQLRTKRRAAEPLLNTVRTPLRLHTPARSTPQSHQICTAEFNAHFQISAKSELLCFSKRSDALRCTNGEIEIF